MQGDEYNGHVITWIIILFTHSACGLGCIVRYHGIVELASALSPDHD